MPFFFISHVCPHMRYVFARRAIGPPAHRRLTRPRSGRAAVPCRSDRGRAGPSARRYGRCPVMRRRFRRPRCISWPLCRAYMWRPTGGRAGRRFGAVEQCALPFGLIPARLGHGAFGDAARSPALADASIRGPRPPATAGRPMPEGGLADRSAPRPSSTGFETRRAPMPERVQPDGIPENPRISGRLPRQPVALAHRVIFCVRSCLSRKLYVLLCMSGRLDTC